MRPAGIKIWSVEHLQGLLYTIAIHSEPTNEVTKAEFHSCSTGGTCSQAPLYFYTRGPISVQTAETFAHLYYLLGGLLPIEIVYL